MADDPPETPNYTRIKLLAQAEEHEQVHLARDDRDGTIVVLKYFDGRETEHTAFEEQDVDLYRIFKMLLGDNKHIINVREIYEPIPRYWSVVIDFCNAGTILDMGKAQQEALTWIPEHLLWYCIRQVIVTLQQIRAQGQKHGDCHGRNVFLHYPTLESYQNPVPIINNPQIYPETVLADFMVGTHWNHSLGVAFRFDAYMFFNNVYFMMQDRENIEGGDENPYSQVLRDLLTDLSDPDIIKIVPVRDFDKRINQLLSIIPQYLEGERGRQRSLPEWLVNHFINRGRELLSGSTETQDPMMTDASWEALIDFGQTEEFVDQGLVDFGLDERTMDFGVPQDPATDTILEPMEIDDPQGPLTVDPTNLNLPQDPAPTNVTHGDYGHPGITATRPGSYK